MILGVLTVKSGVNGKGNAAVVIFVREASSGAAAEKAFFAQEEAVRTFGYDLRHAPPVRR